MWALMCWSTWFQRVHKRICFSQWIRGEWLIIFHQPYPSNKNNSKLCKLLGGGEGTIFSRSYRCLRIKLEVHGSCIVFRMTNLFFVGKQLEGSKHYSKKSVKTRSGTKQIPWIAMAWLNGRTNLLLMTEMFHQLMWEMSHNLNGMTCLKSPKKGLNLKPPRNGSGNTQSTTSIPTKILVKQKRILGTFLLAPYISHHPCWPEQMKASAKSLWRPAVPLGEGRIDRRQWCRVFNGNFKEDLRFSSGFLKGKKFPNCFFFFGFSEVVQKVRFISKRFKVSLLEKITRKIPNSSILLPQF